MQQELLKLTGKPHDLGGGFTVSRILPQAQKRMVGPFTFFDHMGPVEIQAGQNMDVRPHPHIGLSTLTFLLEGRMVHNDSLGNKVTIVPGDVNWMTAGDGISHSERAHQDDRNKIRRMEGLQFWIALPDHLEDMSPSFDHYDRSLIPKKETDDCSITVVAGEAFGLNSSVHTSSPLVLVEISTTRQNTKLEIDFPLFEIGIYVVSGAAQFAGSRLGGHELLILPPASKGTLQISQGSRVVLLGGEPFESPRHIWWNFVSSSRDKIESARQRWKNQTFPMVPGESDWIPAPD